MKSRNNRKKAPKSTSLNNGGNVVRIRGTTSDTFTLNNAGAASAFIIQSIAIGVDPSLTFADRLGAIGPTFTEYRIRSLTAKVLSETAPESASSLVEVPPIFAGFQTDNDAAAPTTPEGIVDNNGDLGNIYNPAIVSWPKEASNWLKTTVGVTNTDTRFYVAGALFVGQLLPAMTSQQVDVLYHYDVELRNPR